MYGNCCVPFCVKNLLPKITFSDLFPKNTQLVYLKNSDLDLISRIHPECGFYGFMIRYCIILKKMQNPFLDSEIRICILSTTKKGTQISFLHSRHTVVCSVNGNPFMSRLLGTEIQQFIGFSKLGMWKRPATYSKLCCFAKRFIL